MAVLDSAGCHAMAALSMPNGLYQLPLLPASPQLQPVERLWSLVDEVVANRTFTDHHSLEAALVGRFQTLTADRPTTETHTDCHW